MVYRLALSRTRSIESAEDIFQEVFMKLSKKIPEFESKEHEKAWLIRVTINCSKNILNSAWNKRIVELEENLNFETTERNDIYFEVLSLPKKDRTIIHLYYYERYKLSEIAKMMNITEKSAKTRLYRARKKLKRGGEDE